MPIPLKRKALAALLAVPALFVGLTVSPGASRADAAVPTVLPLTITNNSGRGTTRSTSTTSAPCSPPASRAGPTPAAPSTPGRPAATRRSPAPDASIAGPASGASPTIRHPEVLRPHLLLLRPEAGLQADHRRPGPAGRAEPHRPQPQHPVQLVGVHPQRLRPVDQQHAGRHVLGALRRRRASSPTAPPRPPGTSSRAATTRFFNALQGPARRLGQPDPDRLRRHDPARARARTTASRPAPCRPRVMDDYVNRVWTKYSTSTLTVTPFADQPNTKYFGRVSGNVMNFTDSSGAVVTTLPEARRGQHLRLLQAPRRPNDLVRGPISRTLCAGYNRSTLLTEPQPAGHQRGRLLPGHGHQPVRRQDPRPDGRRQGVRLRLRRRRQPRVPGQRRQPAAGVPHPRPLQLGRLVRRVDLGAQRAAGTPEAVMMRLTGRDPFQRGPGRVLVRGPRTGGRAPRSGSRAHQAGGHRAGAARGTRSEGLDPHVA